MFGLTCWCSVYWMGFSNIIGLGPHLCYREPVGFVLPVSLPSWLIKKRRQTLCEETFWCSHLRVLRHMAVRRGAAVLFASWYALVAYRKQSDFPDLWLVTWKPPAACLWVSRPKQPSSPSSSSSSSCSCFCSLSSLMDLIRCRYRAPHF